MNDHKITRQDLQRILNVPSSWRERMFFLAPMEPARVARTAYTPPLPDGATWGIVEPGRTIGTTSRDQWSLTTTSFQCSFGHEPLVDATANGLQLTVLRPCGHPEPIHHSMGYPTPPKWVGTSATRLLRPTPRVYWRMYTGISACP